MEGRGDRLRRVYDRRFAPDRRDAKDRVWRTVVERYFQRWVAPDHVVLDLGCGFGEFLNHLRCARRIGVDLNPDSREHLDAGVEFNCGDVCDLSFLHEASVDRVFTSNLMEHLGNKTIVEVMLSEAHRVLKPGGELGALGPNLRFLPTAYWDFWDHSVPITDRALVEILGVLGFRIVECIPRFLPYTTRSRLPQAPAIVCAYLWMPFLWPLVGRQFFIRAAKIAG